MSAVIVPALVFVGWEVSVFFAGFWPHARLALRLFAVGGIVSLLLGVDLLVLGRLIEPPGPIVYPGATWITRLGFAGLQLGGITWLASITWIKLLSTLYPVAGVKRTLSIVDEVSGSLLVAISAGLAASDVAQFTGSLPIALALGIASFFTALVIAWLMLKRVARQRAAGG